MNRAMRAPTPLHTIVCHARPEAFGPSVRILLSRLGYLMWLAEDYDKRSDDDRENDRPALRLVDERRLAEVEDDPGWTPTPVILLTGRHGASGADSRVVGAVRRPAGVHELYRLMQQLLEDHPRSVARVPTHLRVSCTRDGKVWIASILSLSENGCLLRSREPLPLGTQLRLEFELPGQSRQGRVEIEAESAYQLVPDSGLVFSGLDPSERKRIQDFVLSAIFDA